MKFLLLLVMLPACAAIPRDMSGKMFLFPQQTTTARVRLTPSKQDFSAVTVCTRSLTDLRRSHSIFSMATPTNENAFLIIWDHTQKDLESHIKNVKSEYLGLDYKPNIWYSICSSWDSESGMVQLWFDGQPLARRYAISGSNITGSPVILLGQEQDSHGGSFDLAQSFVGMMSDVHMWDHALSSCEIQEYVDGVNFPPGNVLNWSALEFQITDRVLIEDKQPICY
ncbi:serum amyloid P-component-like [Sebastes umbrosus]|uniref:serum amyloid P-component-like n=1 Tax=Sebastes umbrosus TaxID=72105 RepID=UPI00189F5C5E|nr:serum amyloid P-component-like [Sebastes umbrosus]